VTDKAAGYVRVSTDEQAHEGYGLAAQEDAIRHYCQAHGWEVVEFYIDAGRSGKDIKGRPELLRLLTDAEALRFERVVVWRLDRLARRLKDLLEVYEQLEAQGVPVVSIQESIDTGSAGGRMMRSVLGAFAEFERDVITDRIKAGIAEKARQGNLVGPLPLGYLRHESGSVAIDSAIAPLVREAFVMYSSGDFSLRDITGWAARSGLRSVNGNLLDRMSIRKLLMNPTFAGKVTFHARNGGGIVSEGRHPAIVEPELFAQVQGVLAKRRFGRPDRPYGKEPYPLSVVGVCGTCGAPLSGCASVKAGRYRYRYYRCSTAHRRGRAACQQPMVQAGVLEDQIAAYVGGMRLPPEYLGEVVAELRQRRRSADPSQGDRLRRELERWHRLFVLGEIDEDRLKQETAPLKRALGELERPQEVLDVERAVNYLRDVGCLWAESPRHLQRQFVREVFSRIVVEGPQVA
jgi:site-specific DNA recombinase